MNPEANHIAAKAMRLRLMGKANEADELLEKLDKARKSAPPASKQLEHVELPRAGSARALNLSTAGGRDLRREQRESCDAELADRIARKKSYKGAANVDDEYEGSTWEAGESQKQGSKRKQGRNDSRSEMGSTKRVSNEQERPTHEGVGFRRLSTEQDRCQYCFESAERPKHLVVAIANFTYLMLPPRGSLVPDHCYIVPMMHETATRNVDEAIWQELRNFKKCLLKMFADQGKDVLFLETAMGFARQRRHCYIECIPVPCESAKQAPLYFKKAIDEAEDEWSQHNAKKLIDTSQKGLRGSIPRNFPYFHVEFGFSGGYCHVIDDESSFKINFGHDVVVGILRIPEEDVHGRSRHVSVDQQRKKVNDFAKRWEPFDWTKMLD